MNRYYYQIVLNRSICDEPETIAYCLEVEAPDQYDAAMSLHESLMAQYPEWCYKFWTITRDGFLLDQQKQQAWERMMA